MLGAGTVLAAVSPTHGDAAQQPTSPLDGALARNDDSVRALLERQVTNPASPFRGSVANEVGLHWAGPAGGAVETLTASFIHPRSRYHDDRALPERIGLATGFLERAQSPDGNIDLPISNFHSPPDTGFVVHNVGQLRPSHGGTDARRSRESSSRSSSKQAPAWTRGDHKNPAALPRQSSGRRGRV